MGHDYYTYCNSSSVGTDFRRQICRRHIVTSKVDPRAVRVNFHIFYHLNLYNFRWVYVLQRHMTPIQQDKGQYTRQYGVNIDLGHYA